MDLYAQMIADLIKAGDLGEEWRGAFERAPRSAFVPNAVWLPDEDAPRGFRRITRELDEAVWWGLVNQDNVVVTQLDDGADDGPGIPTSSASMPRLVARMLDHLDVGPDASVLDVGTGTGWTTALLSGRVTAERVTSVEIDPVVAAQAHERLRAAGFRANLNVGDGLLGWRSRAPFDAVHSTAAVQWVPRFWIEQTKPLGVIVTPWGTPYANAGLLRLEVGEPGQPSYGRFVDDVSFMWVRSQRPHSVAPEGPPGSRGVSQMDPELALENVHAAFSIGVRVPGVRYRHTWEKEDPEGTYRIVLSDDAGSWASVRYADWDKDGAVHQAGFRRLWDEITAARLWWLEEGKPELTDFGVSVAPNGLGQSVWLGEPKNVIVGD